MRSPLVHDARLDDTLRCNIDPPDLEHPQRNRHRIAHIHLTDRTNSSRNKYHMARRLWQSSADALWLRSPRGVKPPESLRDRYLRGLTKMGKARAGRIRESSINNIVKAAIARTGIDPPLLRSRQSRHGSLASLDGYIRINDL